MRRTIPLVAAAFTLVGSRAAGAQLSCPDGTRAVYLGKTPSQTTWGYCVLADGVPHGPAAEWVLPPGQTPRLQSSGSYAMGARDGEWLIYGSNGKLSDRGSYANGLREGPWSNGLTFRAGMRHGPHRATRPNGYSDQVWERGRMATATVLENGRIVQVIENPVDSSGRVTGVARVSAVDAQGKRHPRFACGYVSDEYDGQCTVWWDNGQKRFEGEFRRGVPWGSFRWYAPDGAVRHAVDLVSGTGRFTTPPGVDHPFRDDLVPFSPGNDWPKLGRPSHARVVVLWDGFYEAPLDLELVNGNFRNGLPDGMWSSVNPQQPSTSGCTAVFASGVLDGPLRCWMGGTLRHEEHFQDGVRHGWLRAWYSTGKLRLEARFANDRLVGGLRSWSHDGRRNLFGEVVDGAGEVLVRRDGSIEEYTFAAGAPSRIVRRSQGAQRSLHLFGPSGTRVLELTNDSSGAERTRTEFHPGRGVVVRYFFDTGTLTRQEDSSRVRLSEEWISDDSLQQRRIRYSGGRELAYGGRAEIVEFASGLATMPGPKPAAVPATPAASGSPQAGAGGSSTAQETRVYAADAMTGNRTTTVLYHVVGGKVYAADAMTGARTDRILRHIVGDRVYAADAMTGARTNTVLRYISGGRVYAADAMTGQRTTKVLSHIVNGKVYAADAMTGARTDRVLRHIVGSEVTD